MSLDPYPNPHAAPLPPPLHEVAEVFVELPSEDLAALESLANQRGLSTACLVRRLIQRFLSDAPERPDGV